MLHVQLSKLHKQQGTTTRTTINAFSKVGDNLLNLLKLINKNGTNTGNSSKDDAAEGKLTPTGVKEGTREKAAY